MEVIINWTNKKLYLVLLILVTPILAKGAWYSGWQYRKKITIDHTKVSGGDWYSTDYQYRKKITVTTGSSDVPSGYSSSVTFDHASLVSAGKSRADGDDIQMTYWNGSSWDELDRMLDPSSSWDDVSTKIWFKTQAAISASSSDSNYYLYYGNASAGSPPDDGTNIFLFYDGFESGFVPPWTDTTLGTGDDISQSTDYAYKGTYSAKCSTDNVSGAQACVYKDFTPQQALCVRMYIYLDSGFPTGDYVDVLNTVSTDPSWLNILSANVYPTEQLYVWNSIAGEAYFSTNTITTGVWHSLETKYAISDTEGKSKLWLDGNLEVDTTGMNTGTRDIDRILNGIFWQGTDTEAHTLYIDECFFKLWVDPEPTTGLGTEEQTLNNFPVLIDTTDTDWKVTGSGGHVGQSDGGDILFTSSDGTTKLDHEIEKYVSSAGSLIAWVEVPALSGITDTDIYIYYGNAAAADQWNIAETWDEGGDSNFVAVWHLNETSGDHLDATGYNNNSTRVNVTQQGADIGKIDGADDFDGTDDSLFIGDSPSLDITDAITIEAWIQDDIGDRRRIVTKTANEVYVLRSSYGNLHGYFLVGGSTQYNVTSSGLNIDDGGYHYVVFAWDKGTNSGALRLFHNGSHVTSGDTYTGDLSNGGDLFIGSHATGERWDGRIDEVRISKVARSDGWIATCHNNQDSPNTFYSVGLEEEAGAHKVYTFTAKSGTGNQTVTSVGFQPKVVLFWITDRTSVGNGGYARFGRGWTDGTNEAAVATAWEDDADSSATRDRVVNNKCITLVDHSGTILAEAEIVSFNSDGFTINWTTAGGSRLVTYLALGSDDLTDAKVGGFIYPADSADYQETGVGFQPDAVLFAGVEDASAFGTTSKGGHGFGIAISSTDCQSSAHRWRNGLVGANSSSSGITDTLALILADDSPNPEQSYNLVSMDSDGFTIKPEKDFYDPAGIIYLAIDGVEVDRGILSQPASTGNQSVTGLSFQPTAVLFDGGDKANTNIFEQDAEMVSGVAADSTERAAFWIGCDSDGSPYPSDTDLRTNAVIRSLTAGTPTLQATADFVSMNSDGFTIDWTSVDATARKIGWIALGAVVKVDSNYRSIGTCTDTLYSTGTASISSGGTTVTFGSASLPTYIGQGDSLTLDPGGGNEEILYILSRDSGTQVTVQSAATSDHSGESYSIERAFNTIQAWETSRDGDLVASNRIEVGVCYDDGAFNELVVIDGSTTNSTHYMHLTVAAGQRHDGTAGTGVVWKNSSDKTDRVLRVYDPYTKVEWLEFDCSEMPSGDYDVISCQSGGDSLLVKNIIVHDLDGNYVNAFEFWSGGTNSRLQNCIAYNLSGTGTVSFVAINQTGIQIDNCTFYKNDVGPGFEVSSGSPLVRNTICMDASGNDFPTGFAASSSNNLSSDATAPGSNSLTDKIATNQFVSIASGSEDLHLRDFADALDAGIDLSATFTDDIDGDTRPFNNDWEMGTDEHYYEHYYMFTDIASSAGVYDNTATGNAGYVVFSDVDNDGYVDVIFNGPNSGGARLYTNDGDTTFTAGATFVDSIERGIAFGDYDNDGLRDVFFVDCCCEVLALYENDGGGNFSKNTTSGLENRNGEGAGWLDYDGDGYLDLVHPDGGRTCNSTDYPETINLWGNDGDGTFTDRTSAAGLPADPGNGSWVLVGDYDVDQDVDIFYGNGGVTLYLFRNNGDGTFTDVSESSGLGTAVGFNNKTGFSLGDYDNDGDFDLFVSMVNAVNKLYKNNGDGTFSQVTSGAGDILTESEDSYGCNFGDFDNDGDLDIFVVNDSTIDQVFLNNNYGSFSLANFSGVGNDNDDKEQTGVALADIDNDGDLDAFVDNTGTSYTCLYRNNANNTNYLRVRVIGAGSGGAPKDGTGAVVKLYDSQGNLLAMRQVDGGSPLDQDEPIVHFGLGAGGASNTYQVRVLYPSGSIKRSGLIVPANESITIGSTTLSQTIEIDEAVPNIPTLLRIFDNALFSAWEESDTAYFYKCTLSVVSTDPQDNIEYVIQWDTDPNFGSASFDTIGPYASGDTITTAIILGSTPAEAETLFYWRARATDQSLWSDWSENHSFTMDMELEEAWPYWYQVAGPQFDMDTKDNVEVQGNNVVLSAGKGQGWLTSTPVVYTDLTTENSNRSHWDGAKWTKSSAADSIGLQIEYKDGGSWSLVPEGVLIGNLNGFFFPTAFCYIDLSSLSTSTYDSLRMKATFKSYTAKSTSDPALEMWALGSKSGITGVSPTDKPLVFALFKNKPNPFIGNTEIRYQLPKRANVNLQVFDLLGRSVVTLVNKEQKPGYYSIQWRGTDKNNSPLPSGVYFLRMEAGDFKATQKMVLLR